MRRSSALFSRFSRRVLPLACVLTTRLSKHAAVRAFLCAFCFHFPPYFACLRVHSLRFNHRRGVGHHCSQTWRKISRGKRAPSQKSLILPRRSAPAKSRSLVRLAACVQMLCRTMAHRSAANLIPLHLRVCKQACEKLAASKLAEYNKELAEDSEWRKRVCQITTVLVASASRKVSQDVVSSHVRCAGAQQQ